MNTKKIGKLKKLRNDVIFIDPKTGEKLCSFNQCVKKFDRIEEEIVTREYKNEVINFVQQHHICNECRRKYRNRSDKIQTWLNTIGSRLGHEPELHTENADEKNL